MIQLNLTRCWDCSIASKYLTIWLLKSLDFSFWKDKTVVTSQALCRWEKCFRNFWWKGKVKLFFSQHGSTQFSSLWFGFSLVKVVDCTWYFFNTTSVEVPNKLSRYTVELKHGKIPHHDYFGQYWNPDYITRLLTDFENIMQ